MSVTRKGNGEAIRAFASHMHSAAQDCQNRLAGALHHLDSMPGEDTWADDIHANYRDQLAGQISAIMGVLSQMTEEMAPRANNLATQYDEIG